MFLWSLQGFWYCKLRPSFSKTKSLFFATSTLNLLYSYFKYKKQKEVVNNKTSSSEVVIAGVLQGSIEVLLLFNWFMNDLILFLHTAVLRNYADANNLYAISIDKEETKVALVKWFQTVINWFYVNYMILSTGKCHYMCMGKTWKETKLCKIWANKKWLVVKK